MITARHADPGAYIPAGGTTTEGAKVTLCDLSVLRAKVPVPEQEAAFIQLGTLARVPLSATSPPIEAKVSRHGRSLASNNASLTVEVDLPNADGKLLSGIYVKTQFAAETHTDALLPAIAAGQSSTIDLATALRLAGANPLDLEFARAAEDILLEKARLRVTREVLEAMARVRSLDARLATVGKLLEATEKSYKLSLDRGSTGVGGVLETLRSEEDLSFARLAWFELVTEYNLAQIALRRACGG